MVAPCSALQNCMLDYARGWLIVSREATSDPKRRPCRFVAWGSYQLFFISRHPNIETLSRWMGLDVLGPYGGSLCRR
jgi:hypothetical protein